MFSFSNIIKFDCLGSWRGKGHDFNPRGFLESYNSVLTCGFENVQDEITLFGKECNFWSALDTDLDWLFNMSRKVLLQLRDTEIMVQKRHEENVTSQEAVRFRSDLSVFLYYIDYYLQVCLSNVQGCSLRIEKFSMIESVLEGLRLIIHQLDSYVFSEQYLIQCSFPNEKLHYNAAYQLIHCCLDFRWFYILIKDKLKDVMSMVNHNFTAEASDSLNDTYLLLMSELVLTSVVKYIFLENCNLTEEILMCPCIKEIWVLLFKYLGLESFWDNFNQILRAILEMKPSSDNEILKKVCKLSSFKFKSTDAAGFTIHLLKGIAELKNYIICKTDYPLNADCFIPFYDNVKEYINSDPPEKSLRVILRVVASIMNDWELEKELVLVLFLEHFHRKIYETNQDCFNEWDSSYEEISGYSFLNKVKNRFLTTDEPNERENSFELFLRLMAVNVQRSRFSGTTMKSLYSRIYIKFDALKEFETCSPLALHQTSSLFLTAAIAFGIEEEVKKIRDLITTWNYLYIPMQKKTVKWKTLVACLLLFVENGYNTKELVDDILTDVQLALSRKEKTLMPVIVECIKVLIENRNNCMSVISSISYFTSNWIEGYVTLSEIHEIGFILSAYNDVIADLREDSEWWSRGKNGVQNSDLNFPATFGQFLKLHVTVNFKMRHYFAEEKEEIKRQLFSHVLPVVKLNVYPCVAGTAAQFFSLFVRNRNWAEAYSLYNIWMQEKNSAANVPSEFIISYYEIERDMSKLGLFKRDYEIDVVRCFIKYHLLNGQTETSNRLFRIVRNLPTTARHARNVNYSWLPEDDNLISFIRLFGACLKSCSAKFSLKQLFNSYFSDLGEWCEDGLSSKPSKSMVNNIYHCCARIVEECHSVIYEENRPSVLTTIADKVFLPVAKYRNCSEIPPAYAEASKKHLPLFIRGLLKLHRKGYLFIKNAMQEIIDFNFPKSPECERNYYEDHPFHACLLDVEITREFSSILEIMFLTKSYNSDVRQSENCIRLFSVVSCPFARDIIFSNVIYTLLNAIMETDCSPGLLSSAVEYIDKCVNESLESRNSLKTALNRIAANESLYCSGVLGNLSKHLRMVCPQELLEPAPD